MTLEEEESMPKIKNKLFQPLTVLLGGGKTLYLSSREVADVSQSDLDTPHLQAMLKRGDLAVTESKPKPGPGAPSS